MRGTPVPLLLRGQQLLNRIPDQLTNFPGHLWRDQWTAPSGPRSHAEAGGDGGFRARLEVGDLPMWLSSGYKAGLEGSILFAM